MTERRFDTQISSKYSPENGGFFTFKERLRKLGFSTAYPKGSEIIVYTPQGFAITTQQEAEKPFDTTQIDFFRKIKESKFHTVYNVNGADDGYLGESASVETAYAIVLHKPIILQDRRNLHFGEKVKPEIGTFIQKNLDNMNGYSPMSWVFDAYDWNDVAEDIVDFTTGRWGNTDYDVTAQEQGMVMRNVLELTRTYRKAWNEFKQEAV